MNATHITSRFKNHSKVILNPIRKKIQKALNQGNVFEAKEFVKPQQIQDLIRTIQNQNFYNEQIKRRIISYLKEFKSQTLIKISTRKCKYTYKDKNIVYSTQEKSQTNNKQNSFIDQEINFEKCKKISNQSMVNCKLKRFSLNELSNKTKQVKHIRQQEKRAQSLSFHHIVQKINARIQTHQNIIAELKQKLQNFIQKIQFLDGFIKKRDQIESQKNINSDQRDLIGETQLQPFQQKYEIKGLYFKDNKIASELNDGRNNMEQVQQIGYIRQRLIQRQNQIQYLWMIINQQNIVTF